MAWLVVWLKAGLVQGLKIYEACLIDFIDCTYEPMILTQYLWVHVIRIFVANKGLDITCFCVFFKPLGLRTNFFHSAGVFLFSRDLWIKSLFEKRLFDHIFVILSTQIKFYFKSRKQNLYANNCSPLQLLLNKYLFLLLPFLYIYIKETDTLWCCK